ncbi:hypothetical protein FQA39_LY12143 [Lamprigera yunnana]|nr:hypothetical protein FQA39_LY12143 [Lamprigera yunnana]
MERRLHPVYWTTIGSVSDRMTSIAPIMKGFGSLGVNHGLKEATDCDTRLTQITDEFWHKLNKTNEWIYILSKPSRITCKNLSYPIDFELFGSEKIKLYNNCKIYADSVIIFSDTLPYLESNYNSILPNFNILHDGCKKHSNHNIDEILIPKIHLNKLDLEELKAASHKLDDIGRLSENLSETENTSKKNSVFLIIVQIVCGILITYLIFKVVVFLVNIIRNKKNPHDHNNTCNSLTNCITLTMCKNQKDRLFPNVSIELSSVSDSEINTSSPRRSLRLAKLKDKECN